VFIFEQLGRYMFVCTVAVIKKLVLPLTLLCMLVGCDKGGTLNFEPKYNNQSVLCHEPLVKNQPWEIEQFWFYVSDLKIKKQGQWQPLLMESTQWQHENVALVGMHCDESGDKNWKIDLADSTSLDEGSAIKFKIAVPFDKNHQNPLKAQGIFDNANMFWTWQQGYKSLRLDMSSNNGDAWAFHVGAIGCQSPSALRSPKKQCRQPNIINVTINEFRQDKAMIIELTNLLKGIEIEHQNRCLSMPMQSSCQLLMDNITKISQRVMFQEALNDD